MATIPNGMTTGSGDVHEHDVHDCAACPVEVRGLYTAAHNALSAWKRGDRPDRVLHTMDELAEALARMTPIVDEHFRATHAVEDAALAVLRNKK